eukprot:COSAG01_NODE_4364_length_5094_cov_26.560561_4_plen_56_part_00
MIDLIRTEAVTEIALRVYSCVGSYHGIFPHAPGTEERAPSTRQHLFIITRTKDSD